ncbi:MAG TPA: hypothetical protein VLF94_03320 [Chlamydiales bacterium]|nr:hypothetical protein [Chlamydiales bacterium]
MAAPIINYHVLEMAPLEAVNLTRDAEATGDCTICAETSRHWRHTPGHSTCCDLCKDRFMAMRREPECGSCRAVITHVNGVPIRGELPVVRGAPLRQMIRVTIPAIALTAEVAGAVTWGVSQILDSVQGEMGGMLVFAVGSYIAAGVGIGAQREGRGAFLKNAANVILRIAALSGIILGGASAPFAVAGATLSALVIAKDAYTLVKAIRA